MWTPPAVGVIKVNIDDFFLGDSGREGIGRMFRGPYGRVFLQFEREVNMDSAVHGEVLALRKGFFVVAASQWASTHSFKFKSDCQSVVA